MSSRRWPAPPPDPIAASALCQVVTGDNGGCRTGMVCDCRHETWIRKRATLPHGLGRRTIRVRADWNISVDSFTGIAVTYSPVFDPEVGHELITEPELARLLR